MKKIYTLNDPCFTNGYETIEELLEAIIETGQDPNQEIYKEGKPTGELAIDLIKL